MSYTEKDLEHYEKMIEAHYKTCPICNKKIECAEDELQCDSLNELIDKAEAVIKALEN